MGGETGAGDAAQDASCGILTLLRHGESEWNRRRRFTGWADIDLNSRGRKEAVLAGSWLARSVRPVDVCFTSALRRARRTGEIVVSATRTSDVSIESSWRLNERHYGQLEGLGVWSAVSRYGLVNVWQCRRRYHVRPPALSRNDPRHPAWDARYASLPWHVLPGAESVADTERRLLPFLREHIVPELAAARHVLVVSHKHTLRALLRLLRERAPGTFRRCPLLTGTPVVVRFAPSDRWMLERSLWTDLRVPS